MTYPSFSRIKSNVDSFFNKMETSNASKVRDRIILLLSQLDKSDYRTRTHEFVKNAPVHTHSLFFFVESDNKKYINRAHEDFGHRKEYKPCCSLLLGLETRHVMTLEFPACDEKNWKCAHNIAQEELGIDEEEANDVVGELMLNLVHLKFDVKGEGDVG